MAKRPRSEIITYPAMPWPMRAWRCWLTTSSIKFPDDSSAIITPFTILIMVSRSTSAELDVADPLENTWRWKEACRHPRFPSKVSGVVNSTYFQTLIKFDLLQLPGGSTILFNLITDYVTYFPIRMSTPQMKQTTRSRRLIKPDERIRWCQDFDRPSTIPFPQLFHHRSMNYETIRR